MSNGRIRRMFPGGNTCLGFYSNFTYIIDIFSAVRVFIIKGGPGAGKSTFIKNIGSEMCRCGYDVDYLHNSSDIDSMDGVVIPAINVALIDGTAPHILDPRIPGAVDEIIDLGKYWNDSLLKDHKKEIINTGREISDCFDRAYRYLKAANYILDDILSVYSRAVDEAGMCAAVKKALKALTSIDRFDLFGACPPERGRVKCLFASAITPSGPVNYLDSLIDSPFVCRIKGCPGTGTEVFLEKIADYFANAGYCIEAFYCGFNPNKLEHVIVPSAGVSFTTLNEYHGVSDLDIDLEIDMDDYVEMMKVSMSKTRLEVDTDKFNDLLYAACDSLSDAKTARDYMESFYKASMDFSAIKALQNQTLEKIAGYAMLS